MHTLPHDHHPPILIKRSGTVVSVDLRHCDLEAEVCSGRLGRQLRAEIKPGIRLVCLNLLGSDADTTQIVAVLVAAERQARGCGTRLLVIPSEWLLRMVEVCRLEEVLPIFNSNVA